MNRKWWMNVKDAYFVYGAEKIPVNQRDVVGQLSSTEHFQLVARSLRWTFLIRQHRLSVRTKQSHWLIASHFQYPKRKKKETYHGVEVVFGRDEDASVHGQASGDAHLVVVDDGLFTWRENESRVSGMNGGRSIGADATYRWTWFLPGRALRVWGPTCRPRSAWWSRP